MAVFRHNPKGRPSAALFGTKPAVPRATLAAWARRLPSEQSWAHPMLLHTDAVRLLRQMEKPGALLDSEERAAWTTMAWDVMEETERCLNAGLRIAFAFPDQRLSDAPGSGGP